jgi:hypothetical protein
METIKTYVLLKDFDVPGLLIKKGTLLHPITFDETQPDKVSYKLGDTILYPGQMSNKEWFLEYLCDDSIFANRKEIRDYDISCENGFQLMIYFRKYTKEEFSTIADKIKNIIRNKNILTSEVPTPPSPPNDRIIKEGKRVKRSNEQ